MIEPADERPVFRSGGPCSACGDGDTAQKYHTHDDDPLPRKPLTLRQLAERFCDEDEVTRDLAQPRAVEYRRFLSRFLIYLRENAGVDENVLEFRRRG